MAIRYNNFVKRPNEEISYTEEQIQELMKCRDDVLYFIQNYVKIVTLDYGEILFEPREYQIKTIELLKNNRFFIGLWSRQSGKTTIVAAYALWYAIFHEDRNIGMVSNKESSAKRILDTMKRMYESLPIWLKPGVTEYAKTSITFDNGTKLIISATTADAFRGWPMNIIICDEFAFVPKNNAEEFWASNYPTISSSETSKVIIISCVTDDTYIYSDKGLKQIKDFVIENNSGGYQIENYNILGKDKLNSGNLFVNSGVADTRIIKTTNSTIEGSLNHKLWACKNGKYGWFKLSELEIGDYVSLQYGKNIWGNNDIINFKSNKRSNKQGVSLEIDKITEDWAYLFGLYIAEGYADKYRLNISCGDNISFIYDKLGIKYTCDDGMHYISSCLSLVDLLKHVGFDINKKANKKEIPKRLLEMSKDNIAAMLCGIFDGDGWSRQDKGFVGIGLSSKKLIEQIKMLLMNFGILTDYQEIESKPTKKVKVKSMQYRLQCDKNSSRKFYELIGFNLERKQNNLHILNEFKEAKNCDLIPYSKDFLMKFKSLNTNSKFGIIKDIEKRIRKHIYNRAPNGHFSRALMLRIKNVLNEFHNKEIKEFFDNNVSENIKWCPITEIKESENKVYDFSLPEIENDYWCHSVIYNGYIGHQTPNGTFNIFHRLWIGANRDGEDWNNFQPQKVTWESIPGKTKTWAKEQIKILGIHGFNQEFGGHFLGSVNTVINPETLRTLFNMPVDPEFFDLKDRLRVWEKPIDGAKYVMGCDPSKGTGEHDGCIQVLKINSTAPIDMEQVACFQDNLTDVYAFSEIIHKLSIYYNNAYILCENNGEGSAVIGQLWWNFENEGLINSGQKTINLGIRSNKNNKPKAVLLMKKLIEDGSVLLRDKETVQQLGSYIEEEGKFFGKDKPDDLVDALYWACYLFEMNILDEDWAFKSESKTDEEHLDAWGILSDIEDDIDDWSWLTNSTVFNR